MPVQDLCNFEDVAKLVGDLVADEISADQLQEWCEGTDKEQGLIEASSRYFETLCGIQFYSRTETFYLSGKGTNMVLLPEHIEAPFTIVSVRYEAVGSGWTESTNWTCTDSGILRLTGQVAQGYERRTDLPRFAVGNNNIQVVVTHGPATTPPDVRLAVSFLCAIEVLSKYTRQSSGGIQSRTLGDRSESYGAGGRFSEDIGRWQKRVDDIVAARLGGIQSTQASRSG